MPFAVSTVISTAFAASAALCCCACHFSYNSKACAIRSTIFLDMYEVVEACSSLCERPSSRSALLWYASMCNRSPLRETCASATPKLEETFNVASHWKKLLNFFSMPASVQVCMHEVASTFERRFRLRCPLLLFAVSIAASTAIAERGVHVFDVCLRKDVCAVVTHSKKSAPLPVPLCDWHATWWHTLRLCKSVCARMRRFKMCLFASSVYVQSFVVSSQA